MNPTLAFEADQIRWTVPGRSTEDRPAADLSFAEWRQAYQAALGRPDQDARLQTLGTEMFRWLDGPRSWLQSLVRSAPPTPLIIEFRTSAHPNAAEEDFLDAPWELLHDGQQHWAAREDLQYCPVRRIGPVQQPLPPSPHRLGLTFMAAAPDEEAALAFEAEEQAILDAAPPERLDLVVEESGSLAGFQQLVIDNPAEVWHWSCHGNLRPPSLAFETDEGGHHSVTADHIRAALQDHWSDNLRLLFLSACGTAVAGDDAAVPCESLTTALLRAGVPAVLGWSGSVRDIEATAFAEHLYRRLANKVPLDKATARARYDVIRPPDGSPPRPPSRDWHLARLYLGPRGGGLLATGTATRLAQQAHTVEKEYLDEESRQVRVASRAAFVGRRRPLQKLLRELRHKTHAGVLLHGFGGHGKSSLAKRAAERLPYLKTVVLFGRPQWSEARRLEEYGARNILLKIAGQGGPAALELVTPYLDGVAQQPQLLKSVLQELLEGPCKERRVAGSNVGHAVLLIVDDFEQTLRDDVVPHTLRTPELIDTYAAVIAAFHDAQTESRLVLTCRYALTAIDHHGVDQALHLKTIHLPPMQPVERRKQWQRHLAVRERAAAGSHTATPSPLPPRELWERIEAAGRGNPRLQDLLQRLILEDEAAGRKALDQIDDWLTKQQQPTDERILAFKENLVLDRLTDLLNGGERTLLQAAVLFPIPVPAETWQVLAGSLGLKPAAVERLAALGLVDEHVDPVTRGSALVRNGLIPAPAQPLNDRNQQACAAAVVADLFQRWGAAAGRQARPYAFNHLLGELSLRARDCDILVAVARDAIVGLENAFEYRAAADFGARAIATLDESGAPIPLLVLKSAAEMAAQIGDTPAARQYNERAVAQVPDDATAEMVEAYDWGSVLLTHARQLQQDGLPEQALTLLERARGLLQDDRHPRERAIVLGDIARILTNKGDVDQALSLHQERLTVYEALGDRRSRAVTLGDIARILTNKGDVDQALRLLQEKLSIVEALGDRREHAITLGDIARILTSKGDVDQALRLLQEMVTIFEALGDRRSRAITLGDIANIWMQQGKFDEAMAIKDEELATYRGLGDRASEAWTHWEVAQIHFARDDIEKALAAMMAAYPLFLQLGRLDGICVVGKTLGALMCQAGLRDEGLAILERSRTGFLKLGRPNNAQQCTDLITRFTS